MRSASTSTPAAQNVARTCGHPVHRSDEATGSAACGLATHDDSIREEASGALAFTASSLVHAMIARSTFGAGAASSSTFAVVRLNTLSVLNTLSGLLGTTGSASRTSTSIHI